MDALDAVLCEAGILDRSPQRGSQRRLRGWRLSPAELVAGSEIPERFREVHRLYLEAYQQRISDVYATTRHKHNSLEKLWAFLDAEHPELAGPAEVRRSHMLAFVGWAIERAREVQRRQPHLPDGEDRLTAHQWLVNVRCFFADICSWAGEDGSPFTAWAPPAVPLERHDLVGVGFEKARRRQSKRQAATILDLEREVPRIRALAARGWQDSIAVLEAAPEDPRRAPARWSASGTGRCWSSCSSRGCGSRRPASLRRSTSSGAATPTVAPTTCCTSSPRSSTAPE